MGSIGQHRLQLQPQLGRWVTPFVAETSLICVPALPTATPAPADREEEGASGG